MKTSNSKLDVFSTFTPLNYFLNIVGLSYIYRDGGEVKHSNSIWKALTLMIIFIIINIITICIKFYSYEGKISFGFKDSLEMFYLFGFIQFIADITLVYKYGRQPYVCYFDLYEYIDSILGIPYYNQIRATIRKMCLFFLIIGIITAITDYAAWVLYYGFIYTTIFSIDYVYLGIRLLGTLDMISNVIQLTYRLKTIGDLLKDYYDTNNLPGVSKVVVYNKMWVTEEDEDKPHDLNQLKTIDSNKHNIVVWLSRCYLLLTEQCAFINTMFGFRTLLACLIFPMDMVLIVNFLIRMIVTGATLYDMGYLPIVSMSMRVVTSSLIILCGFYRCEQNYKESKRIISLIDYLVINKKTTIEIQEKLKEFKDLIISRPIIHHANYMHKLNYATLVSLVSGIVTYTIILLQNMK